MRRIVVLLAVTGLLVGGAVARGDAPAPTVTLTPWCDDIAGNALGAYGFHVRLDGFAPHEHLLGDATMDGGWDIHDYAIDVDGDGTWSLGVQSGHPMGLARVTIHRASGPDVVGTLDRPCETVLPGGSVQGTLRVAGSTPTSR